MLTVNKQGCFDSRVLSRHPLFFFTLTGHYRRVSNSYWVLLSFGLLEIRMRYEGYCTKTGILNLNIFGDMGSPFLSMYLSKSSGLCTRIDLSAIWRYFASIEPLRSHPFRWTTNLMGYRHLADWNAIYILHQLCCARPNVEGSDVSR